MMLGKHLIKSWSSTQGPISLSSGEAEFYGVVKAAGISLGYQALLEDLGVKLPIRVWTDSTATMGICGRQELGKLRHVDTRSLWIQQRVRDKTLELRKVRGEVNPADLFTKHLPSREKVHQLFQLFGCSYREGRPESAPLLRPMDSVCQQDGQLAEQSPLPGFAMGELEAEIHDPTRLPHLHSEEEIRKLFPVIAAAPACENSCDWQPGSPVSAPMRDARS